MKKDKIIKIILLVLVVTVISSTLTSLVVTNSLSGNKILGSVSHSDYLDSSNVTYSNSNVQDSIDSLYTQANDYSEIKSYFRNDPTSRFDGNALQLGVKSSTNSEINLYQESKLSGKLYSDNGIVLTSSYDQPLKLYGNPVTVNGIDIMSYPKIYNVSGLIANSKYDDMEGHGIATVILYPNNLAIINYSYTVTKAGTSNDNFLWGLNRNLLTHLDSNIPTITPIYGGVLTIYKSDGTIDNNLSGYSGYNVKNDEFWNPARVYDFNGTIGGWPSVNGLLNYKFQGTCYGTY